MAYRGRCFPLRSSGPARPRHWLKSERGWRQNGPAEDSTIRATSMMRAASALSSISRAENRTTSSAAACRSSSTSTVAAAPDIPDQDAFERKILTIRKHVLNTIAKLSDHLNMPDIREHYVPSFSTPTVVYKGLLLAPQVASFYDDLRNPLTVSAFALV